jgi:hypothetical protein
LLGTEQALLFCRRRKSRGGSRPRSGPQARSEIVWDSNKAQGERYQEPAFGKLDLDILLDDLCLARVFSTEIAIPLRPLQARSLSVRLPVFENPLFL